MNRLSGRFGQLMQRAFSQDGGEDEGGKEDGGGDGGSISHRHAPQAFDTIRSPLEEVESPLPSTPPPPPPPSHQQRYDPFAAGNHIKVSLSTPGSTRGNEPGSARAKGGSGPQVSEGKGRKLALDASAEYQGGEEEEGGEEGEFEGEEEEEEEEEVARPFDARRAHETFIWRALQGVMTARGEVEASSTLDLSNSAQKKVLKWADEDGGELNNVQFFDRNAEPSTVLRLMLAADARAEGAPGSGKAAMGRDEIVRNMEPILKQIKGNIQEVFPIKMMRNGETRTVLIAGRGPLRTRVGVAIVWMGGLIKHLKMIKNPEPEFLEDPMDVNNEGPFDEDDIGTPRSTESELFVLDPPYLVPRPEVFPTPTLLVQVISAHGLKSSATLPRPVNPYVKLKLGGVELRTNVMTNTKNPQWCGTDHHSRFRFMAEDSNAMLRITVGDWKIGKNLWIARLAIPLASIEVSEPTEEGVLKEFDLRLRVSRFGKHIEKEGQSNAKLVLRLKYEFMERSWTMRELKARDDARIRKEVEMEEEALFVAEGGGVGGGMQKEGAACCLM